MVCYMSLASGLLDGVGAWAVHVCSVGWAPCPTVHACSICMEGWMERVEERRREGVVVRFLGEEGCTVLAWVGYGMGGMGWDGWMDGWMDGRFETRLGRAGSEFGIV